MEQSADKAAMGLRLKRVRKFLGMTQEKMAEILGISDRQYRRYENGTSTPSVSTVMKITGFSDKIDFSYIVSGCSYYIRSGFQRMPEQQLNLILTKSVVNGRFCPQSVRRFCPIIAGFNAGTYKVPACVL